jgi:protein tyrosine phosphatase
MLLILTQGPLEEDSDMFIATQGPLPHTCEHFWNLILNKNIKLIIMLAQVKENGRVNRNNSDKM